MPRTTLRFGIVLGLLAVVLINSGGFSCSASSDDPIYIPPRVGTVYYQEEFGSPPPSPPYYDLYANSHDAYGIEVWIDDIYQGFIYPYEDLTVLECPEDIDSLFEAYDDDPYGDPNVDWGPDIVDTTGLDTYTWDLDPAETFDLSVENLDTLIGAEVYVDDIYQGTVDPSQIFIIYAIPVHHASDIYIEALDSSWWYWEVEDTRPYASSVFNVLVP